MWNWDYDIKIGWEPKTDAEWQWYLIRRINYGAFDGLKKNILKKYFTLIKAKLDPGKRLLLENFLNV